VSRRQSGFTLIELLVVIAIVAILMGDSVWVGAWPYRDDSVPSDLTGESGYPGYPHGQGYFMGRFCVDRHREAINLGFVDSRVDRVPLRELWLQKWHRAFIPNPDIDLP